jgi:ribokinase
MMTGASGRDIDVLVVGDANPDLILRGDVIPRFGQSEQLLDRADLTLGGSGAITAAGLARLGLSCTLVAAVGDDPFGELTRQQLTAAGVDTSQLRSDGKQPTGLSVLLSHDDSRTTLTLAGAIGLLEAGDVGDGLLARCRHVHASSFYLQPRLAAGLADVFGRARAAGASTSLDTNLDPAGEWAGLEDVLSVTDFLLPNRAEVLGIAGRFGFGAFEDVVDAARVIAARGPLVVVKDGERGALAVPPGGGAVVRQAGYPVEAVDAVGAGDSFNAGYLAGYLRGLPTDDCLALACKAGAMSTLGIGGTTAQATAAHLFPPP